MLLWALNELVNIQGRVHFKLLLKGLGSLYRSKEFLNNMLLMLVTQGRITLGHVDNLMVNNVFFLDDTLSFTHMNALYNAADAYVSPYLAEGFNLPVLEAIATGMAVFVSSTGCTSWFVDAIMHRVPGSQNHIFKLDTTFELTIWDRGEGNAANMEVCQY